MNSEPVTQSAGDQSISSNPAKAVAVGAESSEAFSALRGAIENIVRKAAVDFSAANPKAGSRRAFYYASKIALMHIEALHSDAKNDVSALEKQERFEAEQARAAMKRSPREPSDDEPAKN